MDKIDKIYNDFKSQFDIFAKLLIDANLHMNLISKNDESKIKERHIKNCLSLIPYIDDIENKKIIDLGSGAGFPGIILSIYGAKHVTLVEKSKKKCLFLNDVITKMQLHCNVLNDRIENLKEQNFDIITARALSNLDNLLGLCKPIKTRDNTCLFLKGENYQKEIEIVKKKWDLSYKIHDILGPGKIIEITQYNHLC